MKELIKDYIHQLRVHQDEKMFPSGSIRCFNCGASYWCSPYDIKESDKEILKNWLLIIKEKQQNGWIKDVKNYTREFTIEYRILCPDCAERQDCTKCIHNTEKNECNARAQFKDFTLSGRCLLFKEKQNGA